MNEKLKHKFLVSYTYVSDMGIAANYLADVKGVKIMELDYDTIDEGFIIEEIRKEIYQDYSKLEITNIIPLASKLYHE